MQTRALTMYGSSTRKQQATTRLGAGLHEFRLLDQADELKAGAEEGIAIDVRKVASAEQHERCDKHPQDLRLAFPHY